VHGFAIGDEVYYAGSVTRSGSNAEFQLVDARIVARKPASLNFAEAAALPLTTITAWEGLFDRLHVDPAGADAGRSVLIIGGAGGVGSIAIQIAKQIAGLKVITTASRPETIDWCHALGADHVIDHRGDLVAQLKALGFETVDYAFCCNDTDQHFAALAAVIRPQGTICSIVENTQPLPVELLKNKSAAFVWEFMFTRAMFGTPDMAAQGRLLAQVAQFIDDGVLKTTLTETLAPINAANLRRAHTQIESGKTIGKLAIEGF
jgi:alcohol dehydrogenase